MGRDDKKKSSGVDNTFRRTWDKDEFREKAKEREQEEEKNEESALEARKRRRVERDPLHQGLIVQRANLQARDYQVDLAAKLNKTQVVSLAMPLSQQAGYYCSVCDCILRDSQSYLDHINGKWHNRALGMSMRVEKSTAEQVRRALEDAKKKKQGPQEETDHVADGFSREQLERQEAEERKRRKGGKGGGGAGGSEGEEEEEEGMDPEMAAMMGFGGFGTSKK
ncbi:hypothetical protein N2152v2_000515 [Parachlorella kessleri]